MQFLRALNKSKVQLSKHFKLPGDEWDQPYIDRSNMFWRIKNKKLFIYESKKSKIPVDVIDISLNNVYPGSIYLAVMCFTPSRLTYILNSRNSMDELPKKKDKKIKEESEDEESTEEESEEEEDNDSEEELKKEALKT